MFWTAWALGPPSASLWSELDGGVWAASAGLSPNVRNDRSAAAKRIIIILIRLALVGDGHANLWSCQSEPEVRPEPEIGKIEAYVAPGRPAPIQKGGGVRRPGATWAPMLAVFRF